MVVEEVKSYIKLLVGIDIVIHSRGVGIYDYWIRRIKKEPAGVDSVTRAQLIRVRITGIEQCQNAGIEAGGNRCIARVSSNGAGALSRCGIGTRVQTGDRLRRGVGDAIGSRGRRALRTATRRVVDISDLTIANVIEWNDPGNRYL